MSAASRVAIAVLGSLTYWAFALIALFAMLLPCGMGPEADCDMASPFTFWSAAAGFILIYIALVLFARRKWKSS